MASPPLSSARSPCEFAIGDLNEVTGGSSKIEVLPD